MLTWPEGSGREAEAEGGGVDRNVEQRKGMDGDG